MGIDFLDLHFRIEKRFRFKIAKGEMIEYIEHDGRPVRDVTAGIVCDFVEHRLSPSGAGRANLENVASTGDHAPILGYQAPWYFDLDVWPEVQRIISETLHVPIEKVTRDAWLVRDLGMS